MELFLELYYSVLSPSVVKSPLNGGHLTNPVVGLSLKLIYFLKCCNRYFLIMHKVCFHCKIEVFQAIKVKILIFFFFFVFSPPKVLQL